MKMRYRAGDRVLEACLWLVTRWARLPSSTRWAIMFVLIAWLVAALIVGTREMLS